MGFVSDVSRVFVVAVSHGLGPNLAAFRGFRRRYSKARFRDDFEAMGFVSDANFAKVFLAGANLFLSFFFLFNGFRKRRFESFCGGGFAWLGPESFRGFRRRYSKARFRVLLRQGRRFLLEACAKVFLAGANLFLSFFFWARILLLFEAFAGGTPRPDFETLLRQAL